MRESPSAAELIGKIEQAFAHRKIPAEAVVMEGRLQIDSDVEDGLWFQGRDWREITKEDWEKHHWGFSYLSPAAFAYFLPSILILTLRNPQNSPDLAVDSFVWQLDSSPGVENLSPFSYRYFEFTDDEFEAMKEWLLWACENKPDVFRGNAVGGPGDGFGRAFDAIDLIHKEAVECRTRDRED
ncbi:MAG: DUF6714 family protein [Terracidiphilus sp.]